MITYACNAGCVGSKMCMFREDIVRVVEELGIDNVLVSCYWSKVPRVLDSIIELPVDVTALYIVMCRKFESRGLRLPISNPEDVIAVKKVRFPSPGGIIFISGNKV